MQKLLVPSIIVALICGLAIGLQTSLNSAAGRNVGAILTGLLVNFMGGVISGLILIVIFARQGRTAFAAIQAPTLGMVTAAGLLGILIIAGVAFALPKIGVAAGISTIIAGQMSVAVVVDTFGLAGGDPIPFNAWRIVGLGLLAMGTWAILHR
jgi:transporter family-2 protein